MTGSTKQRLVASDNKSEKTNEAEEYRKLRADFEQPDAKENTIRNNPTPRPNYYSSPELDRSSPLPVDNDKEDNVVSMVASSPSDVWFILVQDGRRAVVRRKNEADGTTMTVEVVDVVFLPYSP